MRYYLIAGEHSGDLHGAALIHELSKIDAHSVFAGWGGDLMEQQGMVLHQHYKNTAFMGVGEVLKNLWTIKKNFNQAKQNISSFQPDAVILIDYPGFNLRLVPWIKSQGYKVYYYIAPKLWAWNSSRAKVIKKYVDALFCILPFEKQFFASYDIEVHYVGNPTADAIENFKSDPSFFEKNNLSKEKPIIALLPGSRKQELKRMLPILSKMAHHFPQYQFLVAAVTTFSLDFYKNNAIDAPNCHFIFNQTYDILQHAQAALVTSGTATLETALFQVPQVVVYKADFLFYLLGRILIKVPFISLVNLIAEKKIVEELIQNQCTENQLLQNLNYILSDAGKATMQAEYLHLKNILGEAGASKNTAEKIFYFLTH